MFMTFQNNLPYLVYLNYCFKKYPFIYQFHKSSSMVNGFFSRHNATMADEPLKIKELDNLEV